jgi:glycosyltransferase involved in cell wall biosynthesis
MDFAITMATYKRSDGKTPFFLKRALNSIFSQQYKNFKLFLVGDNYEDENELKEIISKYDKDKIQCSNLSFSPERNKYEKMDLWCCGGLTAVNIAIDEAIKNGHKYICHLDHDDYWSINHLSSINKVIEETNADWVCTKSEYGNDRIFPEIESEDLIVPFLPLAGGIINSSVCYNYQTLPFKYRNVLEEDNLLMPSDADLWDRMKLHIEKNNLISLLINQVSCFHLEEGYTFS